MTRITIEIENEAYQALEAAARKAGKEPQVLSRELLETALNAHKASDKKDILDLLKSKGRIRSTESPMKIPEAQKTLDDVCHMIDAAGGPSLSELIDQQRGQKS